MPLPLYRSTAVRQSLGAALRPGGVTLTRRVIDLAGPEPAMTVIDAGCGPCGSLEMLRERGLSRVLGLDIDRDFLRSARSLRFPVVQADLCRLPLTTASVDLVICECAWNLTPRERSLEEFHRVLRPGGRLAITDMYNRCDHASGSSWPVSCCFAGASDLATVERLLAAAGFSVSLVEDHSRLLRETAARFVFEHGSLQGFWQAVTGNPEEAAQACRAGAAARPGLFLLLATRNAQ